ncbi:type I-E CRISPR-associated protein Cse2/CasB [Azospirillum sp. A1-3]|uniref:type I-E CRISPR-associated protein Cse2/CasB n=1 Tax=Azospirillum sp. A1-3 TaxID=185874 RepID=UPI002076DF03|nr:type I-E CRISPR-associated protein Cse2/CasB [Azospirillum sp. A1-3]MCM8738627.1 type I-E CRISPR-associated protein Cse2/CasB [Azospirillum sp. A1-3]
MPATDPPSTAATDHSLAAVSGWHATLQEHHHRGDRAALRRAQTIDDVYGVIAFHRLLRCLDPSTAPDMAARLAMALATVDQSWTPKEGGQTGAGWGNAFGRAAARFKNGKPRLSEDRLRLLLSAEDPDQFLRLLRGAVHLLGGKAPLVDLARVVWAWHQPDSRARVRRQIFLSYFATLLPSEKTNA